VGKLVGFADGLAVVVSSRLAVGVDVVGELFGLPVDGLAMVVPSGLAVGVDDIGELAIWACSGRTIGTCTRSGCCGRAIWACRWARRGLLIVH
jgi:hypothetical protein